LFHALFKKRDAFLVYLLLEGSTSLLFALIFTLNLVYHVTVVKLNPLQLVLVGTMLETVVFLFEVPTGILADVYSRRISVIVGLILIGFGFMLEGSFPHFGVVLFSQLFWGLGATFTSGAQQAWVADELGEERAGRAFLRGAQIGQIGGLIGIAASVALGSIHIQLPIVLGGFLMMLLGFILIAIMPENGFKPTPREDRNSWRTMITTFRDGVRLIRGRTVLIILVGISLLSGLSSEGWDRLWAAHVLENFTFPDLLDEVVWFGLLGMISMLLSLIATEGIRRWIDVNHPRSAARALLIIHALTIIGMLVFALGANFWVAITAFLLTQMLRGITYPILMAWSNPQIDSSVRATVFSLSSQTNAIGQIAGGPVVGAIGTAGSLRLALVVTSLIFSPVLLLLGRALRCTDTASAPDVDPV